MLKEILTAALAIVAAWLLIALLPSPDADYRSALAGFRHQHQFPASSLRGLIRQEAPIEPGASFFKR